ncbi:MAG: acyltransferase family protein [Ruminococcus sp.]|nr:acyltransferase family protein [Ruminococcus sp.]
MKKRIPELDFIKGIAIILVIIGHVVSQVWSNDPAVYENTLLFRFCYSFHMPLFVFISGWICRMTIRQDTGWLLKRLKRIGIPYILMTALVFFLLRNGNISHFISDSPYWYLLFIIIADSIFFLGEKYGRTTMIFTSVYAGILLLNWRIPQNIGILRQLADFLPFYAAGTLVPLISTKTARLRTPALISSGVLYIALFPLYRHGISDQLERFRKLLSETELNPVLSLSIICFNKFIVPACGIALIFLITNALYALIITEKFRKTLEIAGNHTLAIYLLHDLFFVKSTGSFLLNSVFSIFTAFFVPLILSIVYNILKKKFLNNNLSKQKLL